VLLKSVTGWNNRDSIKEGEIMATTSSTSSASLHSIGLYVQVAGAGAFLAGAVLSLHHYVIGVCFIAGAAAFFIGKKLKGS
jgi:hypothetical protein